MTQTIELPSWPRLYLRAIRPRRRGRASEAPVGFGVNAVGVAAPPHRSAYHALVGQGPSDASETELLAWSYVVLQRLHAALLLRPEMAFPALGLVHLENRLERLSSAPLPTTMNLSTTLSDVETTDVGRRLTLSGTIGGTGGPAVRGDSVYLVRDRPRKRGSRPALPPPAGEAWETLDFAADFGRAYARVSGDRNPIHLWPWSARLFGFRRPIAHGMGLAARVEAGIVKRLGRPISTLALCFRSPVTLPSTVTSFVAATDAGGHFDVRGTDGRRHFEGSFTASVATRNP